jgi:hypothetical protein
MISKKSSATKELINTNAILKQYKIPKLPMQYCRKCGTKLTSKITHVESDWLNLDGYNQNTGHRSYIILAKYTCPIDNKHHQLADGTAICWTEDGGWNWKTAFCVTPIRMQKQNA